MTNVVTDVGGPRVAALIDEGLRHIVNVTSARDIFLQGAQVASATTGPALEAACQEARYIFLTPERATTAIIERLDLWHKTVVLDFTDPPTLSPGLLDRCRMYFKRSWPIGPTRQPRAARPNLHPINFGAFAAFDALADVAPETPVTDRPIDLGFFFAPASLNQQPGSRRERVLRALMARDWAGTTTMIGHHTILQGHGRLGRRAIARSEVDPRWQDYMRLLTRTKIVFTATPTRWDGDHRTWEALWSGACVFMDRTGIPTPAMPRHGMECFYYDADDDRSINAAIDHARSLLGPLSDGRTLNRIGRAGRHNTLNHHLSHHRVAQVLALLNGQAPIGRAVPD